MIAVPDITTLKIQNDKHDFVIIGSDGIYDRMTTEEVVSLFWDQCSNIEPGSHTSIHELC